VALFTCCGKGSMPAVHMGRGSGEGPFRVWGFAENCKDVVSRSTVLENDFEWYQLLFSVTAGGCGALRGLSVERKW